MSQSAQNIRMERCYWPALLVSVAAHVVILGSLLTRNFDATPAVVAPREYLEVSFVRRVPPPATSVRESLQEESSAAPSLQEDLAPAVAENSALPNVVPLPEAAPANPNPTSQNADATPSPLTLPVAPDGGGVVDSSALRGQVTAFVRQQRGSFTNDFVDDCWIERKEGKRRDCAGVAESDRGGSVGARTEVTALFRDVTRNQRHAQLTAQLEERDARLQQMEDAGGVLGELAVERRSIDREYSAYLNGNQNTAARNFVMSAHTNNGNLAVMGNFMQFTCKKMPCIYEFTGFSVIKPKELIEAEAKANTFPYTPTLFGTRR